MIYEYMNTYSLTNFAVVVVLDGIPYLFIIDDSNTELLNGVALESGPQNPYSHLSDNELLIAAVTVLRDDEIINANVVNDDADSILDLQYKICPFKIIELRSEGLTVSDVLELDFLEMLVLERVNDFIDEKEGLE